MLTEKVKTDKFLWYQHLWLKYMYSSHIYSDRLHLFSYYEKVYIYRVAKIVAGVCFCGFAIFCVLRELIFAIRFILTGINYCNFQKVPRTQH